jgi:hypothetical protein
MRRAFSRAFSRTYVYQSMRTLPFAKTDNAAVCFFRHALALDERRAKFKANQWLQRGTASDKKGKNSVESVARSQHSTTRDNLLTEIKTTRDLHNGLTSYRESEDTNPSGLRTVSRFLQSVLKSKSEVDGLKVHMDDPSAGAGIVDLSNLAVWTWPRSKSLHPVLHMPMRIHRTSEERREDEERKQMELIKKFLEADDREFGKQERETDVLEVRKLVVVDE